MPSTIDLVIALSLEVLKRSFAGISGIIKTIKKNNANDLSSLIGKMLRVDVHNIISTSSTTYNGDAALPLWSIPRTIPFRMMVVVLLTMFPEIWLYGLSNPWWY